jgi:drug/metabolite transporter (DMT)-like permease
MVQLAVPVLAAVGGMILLSEVVSVRLIVAGVEILGGICIAVLGKERFRRVTVAR